MTTADETDDSSNMVVSSTQGSNVQDQKSNICIAEPSQYSLSNPKHNESNSHQNDVGLITLPSLAASHLYAVPDVHQEILEQTDAGALIPPVTPGTSMFSTLSNNQNLIRNPIEIASPPPSQVSLPTMPSFVSSPCLDQQNSMLYPVQVRSRQVSTDRTLYIVTYEILSPEENFVPPLLYPQVSERTGKIQLLPQIADIDYNNLTLETQPFVQNVVSASPHSQVSECDQKMQLLPDMANIDFDNPNFETEPTIEHFESPPLHQEISEYAPEIVLSSEVQNVDCVNLKFVPQNLMPSIESFQGSTNCTVIKSSIEAESDCTGNSPNRIKFTSALGNIKLESLDLPSSPLPEIKGNPTSNASSIHENESQTLLEMDVHFNSNGESNSTSNASSIYENESQTLLEIDTHFNSHEGSNSTSNASSIYENESQTLPEMDVHFNSHGESNSTSYASSVYENESQEQDSLPASPFEDSLQDALIIDDLFFFEAENTCASLADPLRDKTEPVSCYVIGQPKSMPQHCCPFPNCDKVFKQKCHLERHMKGHTGKKETEPVSCYDIGQPKSILQHCCPFPNCDKVFKQKCHLERHMKGHTGKKEYQCEHCEKQFVRRDHWSNHMKVHSYGSSARQLICPIPHCRKVYKRTGHLNRHLKGHDGKKEFHCSHCNKRFARKDYLREHILIHFPSKFSNRPRHKCNVPGCNKIFVQSGHLARHMKSHVKVIVCHYCNEKFTRKENLPRHFQRKHAKEI